MVRAHVPSHVHPLSSKVSSQSSRFDDERRRKHCDTHLTLWSSTHLLLPSNDAVYTLLGWKCVPPARCRSDASIQSHGSNASNAAGEDVETTGVAEDEDAYAGTHIFSITLSLSKPNRRVLTSVGGTQKEEQSGQYPAELFHCPQFLLQHLQLELGVILITVLRRPYNLPAPPNTKVDPARITPTRRGVGRGIVRRRIQHDSQALL